MDNFIIRDHTENDLAFIKSAWIQNQSFNMPFKYMKKSLFYKIYPEKINNLVKYIKIKILCNNEFEDQVFGFVAYDDELLYFVYVKGIYRGLKFGSLLLKQALENKEVKYFAFHSDNKAFLSLSNKHEILYNPLI